MSSCLQVEPTSQYDAHRGLVRRAGRRRQRAAGHGPGGHARADGAEGTVTHVDEVLKFQPRQPNSESLQILFENHRFLMACVPGTTRRLTQAQLRAQPPTRRRRNSVANVLQIYSIFSRFDLFLVPASQHIKISFNSFQELIGDVNKGALSVNVIAEAGGDDEGAEMLKSLRGIA